MYGATWFYVPSDEALLLRRPADKRAEPAGKLPLKLIVRLFTSALRVSRIAAFNVSRKCNDDRYREVFQHL